MPLKSHFVVSRAPLIELKLGVAPATGIKTVAVMYGTVDQEMVEISQASPPWGQGDAMVT
jgi:hypothetical protein